MTLFDTFGISGSGLTVYRKWLDAVSDNIANMNTVTATSGDAFQARYVIARSVDYGNGVGGAEVAGTAYGDRAGRVVYQPDHPLADADGMIRLPDIDLSSQMTQLIMAQRGYQANLSVIERAKASYEAALTLGRSS
jgi:flagellar basal-body rod protein FlgC